MSTWIRHGCWDFPHTVRPRHEAGSPTLQLASKERCNLRVLRRQGRRLQGSLPEGLNSKVLSPGKWENFTNTKRKLKLTIVFLVTILLRSFVTKLCPLGTIGNPGFMDHPKTTLVHEHYVFNCFYQLYCATCFYSSQFLVAMFEKTSPFAGDFHT